MPSQTSTSEQPTLKPEPDKCCACQVLLFKIKGHRYQATPDLVVYFWSKNVAVKVGDQICKNCYNEYHFYEQKKNQTPAPGHEEVSQYD